MRMRTYLPSAHILKMASSRSVRAATSRSAIGKIFVKVVFKSAKISEAIVFHNDPYY